MPWELGFKDGHNSRVAIVPIAQLSLSSYAGREYLGIYPYVDKAEAETGNELLWVNRSRTHYITLEEWLNGANLT